ncbi:MAG: two-component system regulatory protein YycI [Bacillota bacterium]
MEPKRKGFEGSSGNPEPTLDPETQVIIYRPQATGPAAREVKLDSRIDVREAAEEYLRYQLLMPESGFLSGVFPREQGMMVEFVPYYQGIPVYSGYVRVDVSARGIEEVRQFWVRPAGYKEMQPKAVRPAAEALLRLAGHLERTGQRTRTIVEVRLGYYSGPSLTVPVAEGISAWDTVPVWRITLDNGLVYYINAFNLELES